MSPKNTPTKKIIGGDSPPIIFNHFKDLNVIKRNRFWSDNKVK